MQAAFRTLVAAARNSSSAEAHGVQQVVWGALQGDPLPDPLAVASGIYAALNGDLSFFNSSEPLTVMDVVALPLDCAEQAEAGMTFESFNESLTAGLRVRIPTDSRRMW